MIKIKKPKIAIIIISSFIVVLTATTTSLVVFNRGSDLGLSAPDKSEEANKGSRQSDSEKKSEAEKKDGQDAKEKKTDKESSSDEAEADGGANEDLEPDVITTEDVVSEEAITFETETIEEVNLPRGQMSVSREGEEGVRRIVTRLTYRNGELIASEVISSEVVREPVSQVSFVGTSDFNLSNSYIQLYPNASVTRNGEKAPAFMILVNGAYYMDFWYDPVTWNRFAPVKAVPVSEGSFEYEGQVYNYDTGPLDSNYALNETFCSEYGLACGRW